MTGFTINLIILPPIVLVAVLFRKSKPLWKRENRVDKGLKIGMHNKFRNAYA